MKHGGDLAEACERYGGRTGDWLDLSTGINPHAYPVPAALPTDCWTQLPTQAALDRLLGAARKAYRCPPATGLVAAPGTQAILAWLPLILPDGDVAVVSPTYSSHAEAWRRAGRQVTEIGHPFAAPAQTRIVVLVNPNNPDGRLSDPKSLLDLARQMAARGGWLVVDEAFADVVPGASLLPHLADEPVLVLRSFGKFFGLAGLRLGFLAGPPEATDRLAGQLDSWAVSGPALAIGRIALADEPWQEAMRNRLADEMADLTLALSEAGLTVFGGTTLYALAAHGNAHGLHRALARRRIWTRVFDYAPTWLRVGLPPDPVARARLTAALAEAEKEL
ncbi:threonine-phosphate decarboxylase CobD [Polymorphum gilvum]|uniref:threonine-phosphate decarboxylase n=1 Tax=Polymorphum gilvum (strain LMG 25793 / CGMCC 1.9160 / SL003B-26A1) TaxID=991905 RepID=F2IXE4_POLGS|nr:threonine-phosphate decarboxylase CobD [Polymorphum gilvum]ADZ70462.1 Aminotransferase, class I and II [Polymorphum gilvum SL003B-26A1]